jgi:Phosphatidylinositol transfer protein
MFFSKYAVKKLKFLCQAIHEILLLGHRQAFVWMDDWHSMTLEDVREYEKKIQEETNAKVCISFMQTINNAD